MKLEMLEARRLLSVQYSFDDKGTLIINGTNRPDEINVSLFNDSAGSSTTIEFKHKGSMKSIPIGGLPAAVVFNGGGGADRLFLVETAMFAPVTVHGGAGDDEIELSANPGFPATVFGDAGDDHILMRGGLTSAEHTDPYANWVHPLLVHGGAGDDRIEVRSFADDGAPPVGSARLYGDSGNDTIIAGAGADRIYGGAGNDRLMGGDGDDVMVGGAGKDRLLGGAGNNQLLQ